MLIFGAISIHIDEMDEQRLILVKSSVCGQKLNFDDLSSKKTKEMKGGLWQIWICKDNCYILRFQTKN